MQPRDRGHFRFDIRLLSNHTRKTKRIRSKPGAFGASGGLGSVARLVIQQNITKSMKTFLIKTDGKLMRLALYCIKNE